MLKNTTKKYILFIMAVFLLAGCSGRQEAAPVLAQATKAAVEVAEPQTAIDAIYGSLEDYQAEPLSEFRTEEQLGLAPEHVAECYGKISDANDGLADVVIILPAEGHSEDVHVAMSKYKEKRMDEFEDYDILDAYSISQEAAIYDQGEYVVMLMLADVEAARELVDYYMPQ
jgi:hypothetical protein